MILFSSTRVPLPLIIFFSVSYMLADISVTLWCLLWYQTSVSRHPNYTFFFVCLFASKQNQLIFALLEMGYKNHFDLLIYGLYSSVVYPDVPASYGSLEASAPAFPSFSFSTQKDWLCLITPFPWGEGVIKKRESCVCSVR